MSFRQIVEKVLDDLYRPFNTTFGVTPDPDWERVFNWYEKRYLNPNSPMRRHRLRLKH